MTIPPKKLPQRIHSYAEITTTMKADRVAGYRFYLSNPMSMSTTGAEQIDFTTEELNEAVAALPRTERLTHPLALVRKIAKEIEEK